MGLRAILYQHSRKGGLMSPEDEVIVDRLKRAIKAVNLALEEAVEAGISVTLEVADAPAGELLGIVSASLAARVRKTNTEFELKIPTPT
jgi:hypothetical protein